MSVRIVGTIKAAKSSAQRANLSRWQLNHLENMEGRQRASFFIRLNRNQAAA
jgi:hypothetical protein